MVVMGIIAGMSPGTYTADGTSNLTIPQAGSQVVTITTNAGAGNVDQNISISLSPVGWFFVYDWYWFGECIRET